VSSPELFPPHKQARQLFWCNLQQKTYQPNEISNGNVSIMSLTDRNPRIGRPIAYFHQEMPPFSCKLIKCDPLRVATGLHQFLTMVYNTKDPDVNDLLILDDRDSVLGQGGAFFPPPQPDLVCGPASVLSNGYHRLLVRV
jgi:hypothetical protein